MKRSLIAACSTAALLFAAGAANADILVKKDGSGGSSTPMKLICLSGLKPGVISTDKLKQELQGKTGQGASNLKDILKKSPNVEKWDLKARGSGTSTPTCFVPTPVIPINPPKS